MNKQQISISLKEIDLNKGDGHNHPDIVPYKITYLARVDGRLEIGYFSKQHYGLSFSGYYDAGLQFDTPGTNKSDWQQLWEIVETKIKKQ